MPFVMYLSSFATHFVFFFATSSIAYWIVSNQPWDRVGTIFLQLTITAGLLSSSGWILGIRISRTPLQRISTAHLISITVILACLCAILDLVLFFASPNPVIAIVFVIIPGITLGAYVYLRELLFPIKT